MKPKKEFRPQNLRTALTVLFSITILAGAYFFYWGLGEIRGYSEQVNQQLANASASDQQVAKLQGLKQQLAQSTALVDKANQLFATPGTYQSRALSDIEAYARAAGLSIVSTNFEKDAPNTVTVKFNSPVSYSKLITFLTNIESNLPKLKVVSISLEHPERGGAGNIGVNDIKIDVSVR